MSFKYLATEQEIKDVLPLSNNVTIQSPLKQSIKEAQESYIRNILCNDLYEDLMLKIEEADLNNPIPVPLTPEYEALREKIIPCLAWYSYYEYLPFGFIRVREASPAKQNGQNIETVEKEDITWLREQTKESAKRNEIRLYDFLSKNSKDYPLWNNSSCCECSGPSNVPGNRFFLYL